MAQFTVTKKLTQFDNTISAWNKDIENILADCIECGTNHDTMLLKEYKEWMSNRDNKFFVNSYETRIWKDDHSAMLAIGKGIVSRLPEYIIKHELASENYDTLEALVSLYVQARDTLASLGKPCRVSSISGTKKLMMNYLDGTGAFKAKIDSDNESESESEESESVETLDNTDKRSAASIAANFMQIAENAQANTAEILAEFAKLVEASQASDAPAEKKAA